MKNVLLGLLLLVAGCSNANSYGDVGEGRYTPSSVKTDNELILDASRAVVQISNPRGRGSGYFIDSRTIVTNCHVVEDKGSDGKHLPILVIVHPHTKDEKVYGATVVSCNTFHDIAIVRTIEYNHPYTIEFYDPAKDAPVRQMDKVWAVGHPLGINLYIMEGYYQFSHALSANSYVCHFTSTPLYPGNSGGALFWINPITRQVKLFGMPSAGSVRADHISCSVRSKDIVKYLIYKYPKGPLDKTVSEQPIYSHGGVEDETTVD